MKKYISLFITAVMLLSAFAAAMPVSAEGEDNLYDKSVDGELLYKVDFADKTMWEPDQTNTGKLNVVVDEFNSQKVTFSSENDKAQNRWGGEFKGLPLNEKTGYTIYFTEYRDSSNSSKDANIGVFIDDVYGIYGYSTKVRFLNKTTSLAGHEYITLADTSLNIAGNTYSTLGTSEEKYCIEVNGQKLTLKLYMMDEAGKYVLVDEVDEDVIPFFAYDNLGLFFYQYNTNMTVSIYDVEIYKGLCESGEKIEEIVETTAAPTEAPVTTAAPETTAAPATEAPATEAPAAVETTAAPAAETTAAPAEKKGCGSSVAFAFTSVLALAAFAVIRKKEN